MSLFFEAAWAIHAPIPENEMAVSIHGTDGAVSIKVVDFGSLGTVQFSADVGGQPSEIFPVVPPHGGHREVVADFLAAIGSGDWTAHRGVAGLRRSRVLDALLASAEQGAEMAVAGTGDRAGGDAG
jgi:predicted dehydrogenase